MHWLTIYSRRVRENIIFHISILTFNFKKEKFCGTFPYRALVPTKILILEVEIQYAYMEENFSRTLLYRIANQYMSQYTNTFISVTLQEGTDSISFQELVPIS